MVRKPLRPPPPRLIHTLYATGPSPIAHFLQLRLARHPKMIGAILKSEGLPPQPERTQLEQYARSLAMVIIRRMSAEDMSSTAPSTEPNSAAIFE